MKYVILIHSNPQPWGHPTSDYLVAHQVLPADIRHRLNTEFEQVMTELQANGELPQILPDVVQGWSGRCERLCR